jgi:hypothetical protein
LVLGRRCMLEPPTIEELKWAGFTKDMVCKDKKGRTMSMHIPCFETFWLATRIQEILNKRPNVVRRLNKGSEHSRGNENKCPEFYAIPNQDSGNEQEQEVPCTSAQMPRACKRSAKMKKKKRKMSKAMTVMTAAKTKVPPAAMNPPEEAAASLKKNEAAAAAAAAKKKTRCWPKERWRITQRPLQKHPKNFF